MNKVHLYQSIAYFNHEIFKYYGFQSDEKGLAFYTDYLARFDNMTKKEEVHEVLTFSEYKGDRIYSDGTPYIDLD